MYTGSRLLCLLVIATTLTHNRVASTTTDQVPGSPGPCTVQLGPQATGDGARNRTFNGVPFCEFLGIPYAQPPIGQLRFADPVFHEPEGHHNYTAYGSKCAQFENINKQTSVIGGEDCLVLNVFTPTTSDDGAARGDSDLAVKLPVLVFIHGGSFVAGSGEVHGVDLLMENDVIVVSLNYRLGVLGFLKDERHNITGNYGLKDQLVALRWVQRYVHHFGGDPGRVTVMGHSAGGGALTHHLYNERARGLFQGAIVLSGSMLAPWAMLYDHQRCTDNYLRDLSATTLDELRAQEVQKFFIKDSKLRYTFAFASMFYSCFVPTMEDHPSDVAYFRRSPHEAVLATGPHRMPILMSETATEFELMLAHVTGFWMSDNYVNNRHPTIKRQLVETLDNICGWVVAQGLEDSRSRFYQKMASMANLHFPIRKLMNEWVKRPDNQEQVYYLRFQFDGKFGELKKKTFAWYVDASVYGAIHGDELGYIFSPYNLGEALANRTDFRRELSVHIKTVELLANFVKYGNPTPKRSKLSDLVWPAYNVTLNHTQYLNIDEEFTLPDVDDRRNIYYLIWQLIYECLYYSDCDAVTKLELLSESYGTPKVARNQDYDYELDEDV